MTWRASEDISIAFYTLGYIFGWDERRETAGKALRAEATRDGRINGRMLDKAELIDACAINGWRYKCQNLGEIILRRNKCGDTACPYCALWKLEAFLQSKMAEIERLVNPTTYKIELGLQRLRDDRDGKVEDLKAVYTEMRLWMTHLTDNAATAVTQVSRDHMFHLYTCLERHIVQSKIILLAEYDENAAGVHEEHFRREVAAAGGDPDAVKVTVVKHENVKAAVSDFQEVAQRRGDWDSQEAYLVNNEAIKGMRLIQGKGIFSGVSGGSRLPAETEESKAEKEFSCPACGFCKPERLPGLFPVATTSVKRVKSDLTGREYITLDD